MAQDLTVFLLLIFAIEISFLDAFRSDYTYLDSTRSYYKFHKEATSWADAKSKCQSEDALFFYPEDKPELEKVLSVLKIGNNNGTNVWIGISDLRNFMVYETVDGRNISQVYNEWAKGWTNSGSDNFKRCVGFSINGHQLYVDNCQKVGSFICKHQTVTVTVTPAIEKVIDKLAGANQTAAFEVLEQHLEALQLQLAETIQEQTTNQTRALQLLLEENQNLTLKQFEDMQQQAANQTAALEKLMRGPTTALQKLAENIQKEVSNQTTALEQLIRDQSTGFQKLAENVLEREANQTAALDRLTLALEKRAGSFPADTSVLHILAAPNYRIILTREEDNNDLEVRSQQ